MSKVNPPHVKIQTTYDRNTQILRKFCLWKINVNLRKT